MLADLVLVEGNPLEDITLLTSLPQQHHTGGSSGSEGGGSGGGGGAVVDAAALAALAPGAPQGLVEAVGRACAAAAAARGSALRLVLRSGLLAVVPAAELLDANRRLYQPVG